MASRFFLRTTSKHAGAWLGILLGLGAGLSSCSLAPRTATILVVSRDQSSTTSLNPSRLSIASDLALRSSEAMMAKGVRIRHKFITYTGEDGEGVRLAEEHLKNDRSVIALVGDIASPSTRLVAELANRNKLVHLSFFATDDTIFKDYPYSFSYRSTLEQEHAVVLNLLKQRLKARRVVLFRTNNATINPRVGPMQELLKSNGIVLVEDIRYEREAVDFKKDIKKIEWTGIDAALVLLSAVQTNHFLQQLQNSGARPPVYLSTASLSVEAYQDTAPIGLELYTLIPSMYKSLTDAADPDFVAFRSQYQMAMGNNKFDTGGLWSFDGFKLLHELAQTAKTPEELRRLLSGYRKKRIVGQVKFNDRGALEESTFEPIRLKNGAYEVVQP